MKSPVCRILPYVIVQRHSCKQGWYARASDPPDMSTCSMPSASAATLLQPCKGSEAYSVSTCARTEKPAVSRSTQKCLSTCKRCECRAVRAPTVSVSSVAWSVACLCLVHHVTHQLLQMKAGVCQGPGVVVLARRAMSGSLLIQSMPKCKCQVASCKLQVSSCKCQVASAKCQVASAKLQVASAKYSRPLSIQSCQLPIPIHSSNTPSSTPPITSKDR